MSAGPELFDTHCHLGHAGDPVTTVEEARLAGVRLLIDVGIDAPTSRAALERARAFAGVRATAGLHPCDANRLEHDWPEIVELAADPACVAIGETGFDFHWDRATPRDQERSFERHLELALRLDKPVVVHCRDAFERTFEVLDAHPGQAFVMHCFAGGVDEARRALELGGHISFAAPVTYRSADRLREAATFAPEDRILVETDAPFLPPEGRRGQPNRPAWIAATAERLAIVRGTTLARIAELTTANASALFGV